MRKTLTVFYVFVVNLKWISLPTLKKCQVTVTYYINLNDKKVHILKFKILLLNCVLCYMFV